MKALVPECCGKPARFSYDAYADRGPASDGCVRAEVWTCESCDCSIAMRYGYSGVFIRKSEQGKANKC